MLASTVSISNSITTLLYQHVAVLQCDRWVKTTFRLTSVTYISCDIEKHAVLPFNPFVEFILVPQSGSDCWVIAGWS